MDNKMLVIVAIVVIILAIIAIVAFYYGTQKTSNYVNIPATTTIASGSSGNIVGGNSTLGNDNGTYPYGKGE